MHQYVVEVISASLRDIFSLLLMIDAASIENEARRMGRHGRAWTTKDPSVVHT